MARLERRPIADLAERLEGLVIGVVIVVIVIIVIVIVIVIVIIIVIVVVIVVIVVVVIVGVIVVVIAAGITELARRPEALELARVRGQQHLRSLARGPADHVDHLLADREP